MNGILKPIDLRDIFQSEYGSDIHGFVSRRQVLEQLVDKRGYDEVTEEDILAFAESIRGNTSIWEPGNAIRFLMKPILDHRDSGAHEVVSFTGPYEDCGAEGFELGLWFHFYAPKVYLRVFRAPIQLNYALSSTLYVKEER